MALLFDIETDGLKPTKIHCLVIKDTKDGYVRTYYGNTLVDGLYHLSAMSDAGGETLVAHNGIRFDLPVIQKLYPWFKFNQANVLDTLVLSRLIYADLSVVDDKLLAKGTITGKQYKSHALEAWGLRLGIHKGNYQGGWEALNQEMLEYCVQDVEVLGRLYEHLVSKSYSKQAIDLEHQVAWICARQEKHGFFFDLPKAHDLYAKLVAHKLRLEQELLTAFKPLFKKDVEVVSKANNSKTGLTKGVPYTKVKYMVFNPGSRDHIALWLKRHHKWEPTEFTADGKPKVDDAVLAKLKYPEAQLLAEYLMVTKRLGQLAEGDQAWLKQVDQDERLRGSVITNGAVTGRATHANPNMAQVPANRAPYGRDCRSLFCTPAGKVLVGADLSGLELRCLAHFMAKWDGGEYARTLLEGDIHTTNQQAAGLSTRDQAKTFIYAFLYGAGAAKIGSIVGGSASVGQRLKDRFLKQTPALAQLVSAVTSAAKRGFLIGLDGRQLYIRSSHAALNTLLQSAGALIAKQALVEFDTLVSTKGWTQRVQQVAWIHDEIQIETDKEIADEVGQMAVRAFELAGTHFGFRIPITGEFRVGRNWAETH